MTNTYEDNNENETIVFRVPKELAQIAKKRASKMMISKSSVCRTALFEYLASETGGRCSERSNLY